MQPCDSAVALASRLERRGLPPSCQKGSLLWRAAKERSRGNPAEPGNFVGQAVRLRPAVDRGRPGLRRAEGEFGRSAPEIREGSERCLAQRVLAHEVEAPEIKEERKFGWSHTASQRRGVKLPRAPSIHVNPGCGEALKLNVVRVLPSSFLNRRKSGDDDVLEKGRQALKKKQGGRGRGKGRGKV